MLAVVQLIDVVVAAAASEIETTACHNVKPGVDAAGAADQPDGIVLIAPVAQVYVLVPEIVGIVDAH
tara:strand:+ start:233 stop:433 length:201 start_codon:yes stop_codon:yes gene_type:complete